MRPTRYLATSGADYLVARNHSSVEWKATLVEVVFCHLWVQNLNIRKFPAFCVIRRLTTMVTGARHVTNFNIILQQWANTLKIVTWTALSVQLHKSRIFFCIIR